MVRCSLNELCLLDTWSTPIRGGGREEQREITIQMNIGVFQLTKKSDRARARQGEDGERLNGNGPTAGPAYDEGRKFLRKYSVNGDDGLANRDADLCCRRS